MLEKLNNIYLLCSYDYIYHGNRYICYFIPIIRIKKLVADMEQFHFEACSDIPDDIIRTYFTLKHFDLGIQYDL